MPVYTLTRPLLLESSVLELFPPELLASSSDRDSRLSVDWPLIIRILGDFSSWKLFSCGCILLRGDVRCFPLAANEMFYVSEMFVSSGVKTSCRTKFKISKHFVTHNHYRAKFSSLKHENESEATKLRIYVKNICRNLLTLIKLTRPDRCEANRVLNSLPPIRMIICFFVHTFVWFRHELAGKTDLWSHTAAWPSPQTKKRNNSW